MVEMLIKAIEENVNNDDMQCNFFLANYCETTECTECVFDKEALSDLLRELKELVEMKRKKTWKEGS